MATSLGAIYSGSDIMSLSQVIWLLGMCRVVVPFPLLPPIAPPVPTTSIYFSLDHHPLHAKESGLLGLVG